MIEIFSKQHLVSLNFGTFVFVAVAVVAVVVFVVIRMVSMVL